MKSLPSLGDIPESRFLSLMTSERLLQQAVAGLLSRMPSVQNVQILHGAQELGKDVVFQTTGPLGEVLPCACIIKNQEITGSAESSRGARAILHQVEQALETPYLDGAGNDVFIQRAYVITPHKVSPQAVNSISGALKQRIGQILFIDGRRLFELFLEYWPDFLADEAVAVESFLRRSAEQLSRNPEMERVAILYDLTHESQPIPSLYIDLDLVVKFHEFDHQVHLDSMELTTDELDSLALVAEGKKKRVLESIKLKFLSLSDFVNHLMQCGYWDRASAPLDNDLPLPLRDILTLCSDKSLLPADWNERAAHVRRTEMQRAGKAPRALLFQLNRDKSQWLHDGLKFFRVAKESASKSVSELASDPGSFRFDDRIRLMEFDNCSITAPWNTFELLTSLEIRFPTSRLGEGGLRAALIAGPAGSGKTSFCRWNALRDAKAFLSDDAKIVPVYVPLHQIQNDVFSDIRQLIIKAATRSALIEDAGEFLVGSSGTIVRLYLDGLDEVYLPQKQRQFVSLVQRAVRENENLQIFLTSRDHLQTGAWMNWLPRMFLGTLKSEDLSRLARQWLGDVETTKRFEEEIGLIFDKSEFEWTPLLATLTLMVFRQTRKLPESRTRLYEIFVDLLCGGWDLAKGVLRKSHFERDSKVRLLSRLAFKVHSKGLRFFGAEEIEEAVDWIMTDNKRFATSLLLRELTRDAIIISNSNRFQFRHLSFQEFLAARYCLRQPKDTEIREIMQRFSSGQDWWREVVRFYIGLCGKSKDLHRWINALQPGPRVSLLYAFLNEAK